MLVANSGGNSVLAYLGLGDGRFGPAQSFFTGTNPAGLTVADVNDDGAPDVVVANQGSNDVTVLLGQGSQDAWALAPGPRLQAGAGPVSTVAQDVTGDGRLDLLVSNSLSNDVHVLPGLGGGFFNDTAAGRQVIPVGTAPGALFVGAFDRLPGLDLVALNAGSDSVTLVSGVGGPSFAATSFASGGLRPVAGLAGDFDGNGLLDLLLAHNGDGSLALLAGGDGGLALARTVGVPGLVNLTDVALAGLGDGQVSVYLSAEGQEAALRFTLALALEPVAGLAFAAGQVAGLAFASRQVAELVPLQDSSTLAVVATLLAVATVPAADDPQGGAQAAPEAFATLLPDAEAGTNDPGPLPGAAGDDPEEAEGDGEANRGGDGARQKEARPAAGPSDPAPYAPYVLGLEEAFERSRRAVRARLFAAPPGPAAGLTPEEADQFFATCGALAGILAGGWTGSAPVGLAVGAFLQALRAGDDPSQPDTAPAGGVPGTREGPPPAGQSSHEAADRERAPSDDPAGCGVAALAAAALAWWQRPRRRRGDDPVPVVRLHRRGVVS